MSGATTKRGVPGDTRTEPRAGFHSVLVPVDLTASSDRVLERVALLPLSDDARVTLLHVVPAGLSADEQRRAERDAGKALGEEARRLRRQVTTRVDIQHLVKAGSAAKEIAAGAARARAELVVMGRASGRTLRDGVIGSTAERVLRQAKLPVLVARLRPHAPYRRPALALDLDEAAREVVRVAIRVLPPPRPRVEIIHAFDVPYKGMIYPSLPDIAAETRKEDLRLRMVRRLARLLASELAQADAQFEDGPSWRTHVQYGSPRLVVEKFVKKAESDLLALGTHGYSGVAQVFLGSVAGDLLRATQCDVLVVPPPHPRG